MNVDALTTCVYCPRLCRHVCPVAVGTGREAALPGNILQALLLERTGARPEGYGRAAVDLCLGCGACEAHCKQHRPVPSIVREARGPAAPAEMLGEIVGDAARVCVLTDARDWSVGWGRTLGVEVATLRTNDELGYAAWVSGEDAVLDRLADLLSGRAVITGSAAVAAVASAAGLAVERLSPPQGEVEMRCCIEGPSLPTPDRLACCGRREGFAARLPDLARAVAEENVRLLDGRTAACSDDGCATWLRAHGAIAVGPLDGFLQE